MSIKNISYFLHFNRENGISKKIQPQYLSSSYRCGKSDFWINMLRLILVLNKKLSDSDKLNCLKSDKLLLNNGFKDEEFLIRI